MSLLIRLMTLVWIAQLYAVMTSASGCVFPAFMTRMPHWYSHVTKENTRIGALWRFTNNSLVRLTDYRSSPATNTYFSCHVVIDREIVLTSFTRDGAAADSKEYRCLRFIRRSDFVVQLARSGVFATGSPDHCMESEQFVLDDSVLVYPVITGIVSGGDQRRCGLVGGYWLSVVDSSGVHSCRQSFLRPIIEADCASPGEGVLIDFRQLICAVPSLSGTDTLHRMVCLGSWTQSGSVFTVLSDNKVWPKLWMLKIPVDASEPITARFLTSLTTGPAHNDTAYYVSLSPASFPTLCENEATGCDRATHCSRRADDDDSAEVHCQKECNACVVASGGSSCRFSDNEHGEWLEMSRRHSADDDASRVITVTVTNKTLQFGTQPAWRCIELNAQTSTSDRNDDSSRRPVAMVFEEAGCRPRMACVETLRRSDAVIQYRMGGTVTWPDPANGLCSDEMFAGDDSQRKILVHREKYVAGSAVACEIGAWYHLNGSDSSGHELEGYVDACGSDVTAFRYVTVVASSSDDDDAQVTSQETHRCLATFAGHSAIPGTSFTYIITAVAAESESAGARFFCWLMVRSPLQKTVRLHLSYAADCRHSATGIELSFDEASRYIAHFDLVVDSADDGWSRNCSWRHLVPVVTPGLSATTTRMTTPGLANTLTTSSAAKSLDTNVIAAAAAATGIALIIIIIIIIVTIIYYAKRQHINIKK